MHTKDKGTLGECAFMKEMALLEIPVFKEIGDNSKTDLIILVDYNPLKIQAKAYTLGKTGVVTLSKNKSGPNYKFVYEKKHIDIFSVYVLEMDLIFYVPFSMFGGKKNLVFRVTPSKNKQKKHVRFVKDFMDFSKIVEENFGYKIINYEKPLMTFKEIKDSLPKKEVRSIKYVTLKCSFCEKLFEKNERLVRYSKKQKQKNFYCCRSHQVKDQHKLKLLKIA